MENTMEKRIVKIVSLILLGVFLYTLLKFTFIWVNPVWGYEIEDYYGHYLVDNNPDFKLPLGFWVKNDSARIFTIHAVDGRTWRYSYTGDFLSSYNTPIFYYVGCGIVSAGICLLVAKLTKRR